MGEGEGGKERGRGREGREEGKGGRERGEAGKGEVEEDINGRGRGRANDKPTGDDPPRDRQRPT